jgi:antitoxin (DNA-binding transcriptional repressor) of toxin-antitoxin stability system
MSDIVLNIHEAKSNLSQYLNRLKPEDRIILCKRNKPIAEVRLLPESKRKPRRLGVAKGEFEVTEAFFEPLPPDLLDFFEGKS